VAKDQPRGAGEGFNAADLGSSPGTETKFSQTPPVSLSHTSAGDGRAWNCFIIITIIVIVYGRDCYWQQILSSLL